MLRKKLQMLLRKGLKGIQKNQFFWEMCRDSASIILILNLELTSWRRKKLHSIFHKFPEKPTWPFFRISLTMVLQRQTDLFALLLLLLWICWHMYDGTPHSASFRYKIFAPENRNVFNLDGCTSCTNRRRLLIFRCMRCHGLFVVAWRCRRVRVVYFMFSAFLPPHTHIGIHIDLPGQRSQVRIPTRLSKPYRTIPPPPTPPTTKLFFLEEIPATIKFLHTHTHIDHECEVLAEGVGDFGEAKIECKAPECCEPSCIISQSAMISCSLRRAQCAILRLCACHRIRDMFSCSGQCTPD